MYPDYGMPGNPNMDPYYVSPEVEAREIEAYRDQEDNLRQQIAAALNDERARLYLADVRRIVIEELNKLTPAAYEPAWQTKTPVPVPDLG